MGSYATGDVQAENRYYPVFRTDKSENRLTSIESLPEVPAQAKVRLEFTYDYMGRRVTKTVLSGHDESGYQQTNEVTFVYDGWNLIAALDEDLVAGTTSTNFYLWGLDLSGSLQGAGGVGGLLATTQDGASYLACMDGNGNVIALVDASDGTLAGEYEYGPFGEPLKAHGDAAENNAVRFSSKYFDEETGLGYWGYRFYHPDTGRFTARDPMHEAGGRNLFAFVRNEPVANVDVLGLEGVNEWSIAACNLPTRIVTEHYPIRYSGFSFGPKNREWMDVLEEWTLTIQVAGYSQPTADLEDAKVLSLPWGTHWVSQMDGSAHAKDGVTCRKEYVCEATCKADCCGERTVEVDMKGRQWLPGKVESRWKPTDYTPKQQPFRDPGAPVDTLWEKGRCHLFDLEEAKRRKECEKKAKEACKGQETHTHEELY